MAARAKAANPASCRSGTLITSATTAAVRSTVSSTPVNIMSTRLVCLYTRSRTSPADASIFSLCVRSLLVSTATSLATDSIFGPHVGEKVLGVLHQRQHIGFEFLDLPLCDLQCLEGGDQHGQQDHGLHQHRCSRAGNKDQQ